MVRNAALVMWWPGGEGKSGEILRGGEPLPKVQRINITEEKSDFFHGFCLALHIVS